MRERLEEGQPRMNKPAQFETLLSLVSEPLAGPLGPIPGLCMTVSPQDLLAAEVFL